MDLVAGGGIYTQAISGDKSLKANNSRLAFRTSPKVTR